jgi:hypothetical protein
LLAFVLLNSCRARSQPFDQAPDIHLEWQVKPSPAAIGDTALTLLLRDPAGEPVVGAALSVRGDMAHAGMQPVLASCTETAPGEYAGSFSWTMVGEWILTISGDLADGRQLLRTVRLPVQALGSNGD